MSKERIHLADVRKPIRRTQQTEPTRREISNEEIEERRAKQARLVEITLALGQTQLIKPCQNENSSCINRNPDTICRLPGNVALNNGRLICSQTKQGLSLLSTPESIAR